MSQIQLDETERAKLIKLHRGLKNKRSSDRIKAILMMDKGYSAIEIAEVLLLEEKTIRRWHQRFLNKKNLSDYIFTDCRGYDGKLNAEQKEAVSHYVESELISDSKQVRHFIETEFGLAFSKSGVIQLLHELGFRYKQTSILPSKMAPKKQSEFKKAYDEFSKNLKEDEAVLFVDGMHPVHNLETGKAWIKVGEKKEVLTNSGRQRCNLNGAYNPHTQDLIVKDYSTINTHATIDLFESIESFYPNKASIFVIVDNAKYYKNDALRSWLKSSRIELIYLPPYSPNLNLIERFWKFLKSQVITNTYYESFSEFKKALLDFCNKASPEHKALLKKSVGTKLHLLKAVGILLFWTFHFGLAIQTGDLTQVQLKEDEQAKLIKWHIGLKKGRIRDRIKIILMVHDRYGTVEIAKVLLLEETILRLWYHRVLNKQELV